jgi:hypothetical protein
VKIHADFTVPEKLPGETTLGDFRDRIIDCDINL